MITTQPFLRAFDPKASDAAASWVGLGIYVP